ncbi:hypothetical protein EJB05_29090, partial [Eragrostis curvula]
MYNQSGKGCDMVQATKSAEVEDRGPHVSPESNVQHATEVVTGNTDTEGRTDEVCVDRRKRKRGCRQTVDTAETGSEQCEQISQSLVTF